MIDLAAFGLVPAHPKSAAVGQKIEHWTFLAFGKKPGTEQILAVAQCDCGSEPRVVQLHNVRQGLSKNCGCVRRANMTKHGVATRTDPISRTIYRVWRNMMERCNDPNAPAFKNYGGRGVTVCERWHNAEDFAADMRPTYQPGLSIERRDNEAGYSPDNCYWATRTEQTRNRRTTLHYTLNGETKPLGEWVGGDRRLYQLVKRRIEKGWTLEEALKKKPRRGKSYRQPPAG